MGEPIDIGNGIELLHVEEWPQDEIVELYNAGGWWKNDYDPSGIPELIKGSFDFTADVVAYEKNGELIDSGKVGRKLPPDLSRLELVE